MFPPPPYSSLGESHIWIEFVVGSFLCLEVFFLFVFVFVFGPLVLLASQITAICTMLVTTFLSKMDLLYIYCYSFSKLMYKNLIFGHVALQSNYEYYRENIFSA